METDKNYRINDGPGVDQILDVLEKRFNGSTGTVLFLVEAPDRSLLDYEEYQIDSLSFLKGEHYSLIIAGTCKLMGGEAGIPYRASYNPARRIGYMSYPSITPLVQN